MDISLMLTSLPKLLGAAVVTLKLLSLSLLFGIFIGLLFAILRLNKNPVINKFAYGYSYLFRGTPLLVQIFIIYFGLGQVEYFRSTFLWVIFKEPYWCAIIAFALNTGAYTSEILRSAFQTIKPGIIEAGKSLGISNKIIFYKIQIPVAIRQSLPAYGNEIILMMKGTSLASTVTLMDLTGVAKYIISTTFKPIEVFIVAGGIYLFMTFLIKKFFNYFIISNFSKIFSYFSQAYKTNFFSKFFKFFNI
jgi:octopine/nopaline transport system permease protein